MRLTAPSHRDTPTFLSRGRALVVAAMLGASTVIAPATWAQDASPQASPAATPSAAQQADVTTLMQSTFEEFPPAPMTVRMLRISLEPGASTPMHTHPGPEFDLIEKGALTVRTEGDAQVTRADGTTETSSGDDVVLESGDWIMFPPEVGMYYINEGDETVEMLSAVMLPVGTAFPQSITYTDGQPTSQDFAGVSFVVLGDGLIQEMPDAPVEVSVNDVTLPAGADLPAIDGIAMYSAIEGNFSFIVNNGLVQVSRSELASLQPNAVTGEEFILEPGDAAFFPAGVEATPRQNESGEMRMLTLEMDFQEPMDRDPAQLTFTNGTGATGDATGGPETGDVQSTPQANGAIGQTATVNADNVNMRAEANTTADVVDQVSSGVEVEVIGGPVEGEGYTWYEIQVADGGSSGWMASDFLDGLTEPAAEPTPTAAASDTADGTATSNRTFKDGDTVQITEDGVRIRAEGNLGGDIVDAFTAGTQFEVTGDPVDADGYTWYPVTSVDDPGISGWVTSDFIEAAP